MSNKILIGKHEGKTLEWLFFHDPQYASWLYDNGIHRQPHFGEEQGDTFQELYRRAEHLSGPCSRCKERPISRMALATSFKHGELLAVGFYCDECDYHGGSRTGYYRPSLFVEAYTVEPREQRMILNEIRRLYIGADGNLTQMKMEAFFHNDANFYDPTPGFFDTLEVQA